VGAGIVIYKFGDVIKNLKYKLNIKCTNNQAEQLAILKALQYTVNIHGAVKTATVYTDSRITLVCLKNNGIHGAVVEKIRQKLTEMKKRQWHMQICWVKENETAAMLAKEAAASMDTPECYDEVPISVVKSELEVLSVKMWHRE
jgi:ribonuclease HI